MDNIKRCSKRILSIIIMLTIIINLIPNFHLIYASTDSGFGKVILKKGTYNDDNKVFALDLCIRDMSFIATDLTFTYPNDLMEIIRYEEYEKSGKTELAVSALQAIKSNSAVTGATIDSMSEVNQTSGSIHPIISVYSTGGSFSPCDITSKEETIATIYFHITDTNLEIADIETKMFNIDSSRDFYIVNGEEEESDDPDLVIIEGFKGLASPKVKRIEVSTNPTDGKEYIHGDEIDLTNGELTLTYTDGSTKDIFMLDEEVIIKTGENLGAVADINNTTLTFEYEDCSANLNVTVIDAIDKIEFYDKEETLKNTEFKDGDELPKDELYIKATTKSGAVKELNLLDSRISLDSDIADITKISTPYYDSTTHEYYGVQKIGITYTDKYTTTAADFSIVVNDKVGAIKISTTNPPKTEYTTIDTFSKTGAIEIIGEGTGQSYGEIAMSLDNVLVTELDGTPVDLTTPAESKELSVSYEGKTTTYTVTIENIVKSIKVNGSIDEAKYKKTLAATDFAGITVTEIMADGTEGNTVNLDFAWVDTSSFDSTLATSQNLKVNYPYGDKTIEGTVKVRVKDELLGITINDFVSDYKYNDELDYTGAQFTVKYVSGEIGPIEFGEGDLEVTGFDSTRIENDQVVTFTYDDGENTASATITVNINKAIPGYTIPTGLEGYEGNELSSIDITSYPGFSWDNPTEELTLGTDNKYKTTMTYTPNDTTHYEVVENIEVEISVIPVEVSSIEITKAPDDVDYAEGENFDPTGMEIKVTYNTGKEIIISNNYEAKGVTFNPSLTDTLTTADTEVTVSYGEKTDTQNIIVETKKVTSIEVTKAPTKASYIEGETLNLAGMEITANYNDGDKKVITNYITSPANGELLNTVGTQAITVTYAGTDAVIGIAPVKTSVEVGAKKVTSIEVTKAPTKASYIEGQTLDLTGMVVTANYNDGDKKVITNYTTNPTNGEALNTVGTQEITITYAGTDAVVGIADVTTSVNVGAKVVTSIEVTNVPTKTVYVEGHTFDPAGMEITANYNDGDKRVTTDYTIAPSGVLTPANTTITVTYTGTDIAEDTDAPTATVNITVSEREIESIAITKPADKTNYIEGQNFDPTGIEITVTYNDHENPLTIDSDYIAKGITFTPSTNLQQTDSKVIVSYRGKDAEQVITVAADTVTDITITAPDKLEYNYGEGIDLTGATITKVWVSNLTHANDTIPMTKDMLSNNDITSFDNMNSLGIKEIAVTYDAITKANAFQVTINDYVDRIEIEDKTKLQTEYEYNDTINVTDKDTGASLYVLVKYAGGTPDDRVELTTSMVSEYSMTTLGDQTVKVTHLGKTDSYTINVKDKVIGIEITNEPAKKVYKIGESASFNDIVVKNIMASSAEGTALIIGEYTFSGFDSTTTGEKTITVTKNGTAYTDTFKVKVIDATTGMTITNIPKTRYNYGEALSLVGGTITVTTQENTAGTEISMADPSVTVTGYNPNKLGDQELTVIYSYAEETDAGIETKTLTDTYTVTVSDYETGTIQVTPPIKTIYNYGESLDLTGGKVAEKMASGATKNEVALTGGMVSGYNATVIGTQTLTVTHNGKTTTFNVTVQDLTLGISMNKLPNKTEYTQGQAIDITGAVINVTKQSGIKEIPVTREMISGYNANKVGTQVITVAYDGQTAQFVVTVKAKTTSKPTNPTSPSRPTVSSKPSTSNTVKYTVKFIDYNGEILKEEVVESGKSATAPELEERIGYKFLGWDRAFDTVERDMIITAKYEEIVRAVVKAPSNIQIEEGDDIDLSEVTLTIRDEEGNEIDEIAVTEDMISGFNTDKIGTQIITVTYVGEDGYEYEATFRVTVKRAEKPVETLGEKDEVKEETNTKDTLILASTGLGITALLLLLIILLTRKNTQIYEITEDKKELIGKAKISKNNTRIVLDEYEKQLENANMIEIVLNKNVTKKLDGSTVDVVRKGMKSTYKVSSNLEEKFNIRIKNN